MSDLFKTLRLALYVIALPLAVTAVVSAESMFSTPEGIIDESGFEVNVESASVALDATHSNQNHVLAIDQDGGVTGQIMARGDGGFVGAAGMDVSVNHQGRVVASAVTGDDGVFRLENLMPGAYTFIATSVDSLSTFGVYVFDREQAPAAGEIQFSIAVAASNAPAVREIINAEVEPVAYTYMPNESEIFVANEISQVNRNEDGSVNGRIAPLMWQGRGQVFDLTGTQVYLLDSNGVVASASVNADGSYMLPSVEPGVYDFVTFGSAGAAALSIEVVGNETIAQSNTAKTSFVSTASAPVVQEGMDVVLGEPTSGAPPVTVEVMVNNPPMYPGTNYGGGGGGGGGYGGGIGDWGGLIGLAIGAWALSELIDSNDNGVIQQPVVVPPVVVPPPTSPF